MAKKRKKTRKELLKEPDEFMTLSGKLIKFAVEHKNSSPMDWELSWRWL